MKYNNVNFIEILLIIIILFLSFIYGGLIENKFGILTN